MTTHPPPPPKLRTAPLAPPFHVVLVEPEIPPNTGSIARTCAATNTPLHLVGRLGFRLDEHSIRRAGLDYWHLVQVQQHAALPDFERTHAQLRADAGLPATPQLHYFSGDAEQSYLDAPFAPGDALVFGKESVGLPRELLDANRERVWGIPMSGGVRSLNLSNAVSIVLFEALRRCGALGPTFRG
jgi:tRNA (cytidine/uridine-2'-O-)-methyltransferase